MKSTARAHSNIAFIKYWGKKDENLRLPTNGSISMNLDNLFTTTTVEFMPSLTQDDITVNNIKDENVNSRVSKHLDRIRSLAKKKLYAKVVSQNSFASSAGMASSPSGFAALTLASLTAIGVILTEKDLSIVARQGSGSACRSIPNGFVEWKDSDGSEGSYAYSLHDSDYWDICDVVTVISKEKKEINSSEGQKSAQSSVFFKTRLSLINEKIETCKNIMREKDFDAFGKLIELEALELQTIMLTSWPSLLYLEPTSLAVMKMIQKMREGGIPVYFTIDAGPNIHAICLKEDAEKVEKRINTISEVIETIRCFPSKGTYLIDENLF